jgi:hypothetical protein
MGGMEGIEKGHRMESERESGLEGREGECFEEMR